MSQTTENTQHETHYVVSYGAKSPKQRKSQIVRSEDAALKLFAEKESNFHVSVDKIEVIKTTRRTKIA